MALGCGILMHIGELVQCVYNAANWQKYVREREDWD